MARMNVAEGLRRLFGKHTGIDESFFEELADSLIEGDLGPKMAWELSDMLEKKCRKEHIGDKKAIVGTLKEMVEPWVRQWLPEPEPFRVSVYLVLGVNGVGKTTSVAKMGHWFSSRGFPVVLAAADTFRAAAIEQLQLHGQRLGLRVVAHKHGADPGAVVYDAAEAVRSSGGGLVLADTAGRLHNKDNLVRELQKIDRIAASRADEGCYKKLLVLDATTGQNGLRQAEVFHESIGLDGLILTKYDSTARGGIAVSAGKELALPVCFIGTGETYADFAPFDKQRYISEFIGES